jgi:TetR/AcrR family transcriptional regulator, cholesterol catabolism regulator
VEIREKIISTAMQHFMRYGIKGVTMDDIARELAISKKTIYQYFKDKKEIVRMVMKLQIERQQGMLREVVNTSTNALETFHRISITLRKTFNDINPVAIWDMQKYHKDAWKLHEDCREDIFQRTMIETIKQGQQEGLFRTELDAEVLAVMRMEQVQLGFNFTIFPREKYDFAKVQLQLFDHFIHGMLTAKGKELFEQYINTQTNEVRTEA